MTDKLKAYVEQWHSIEGIKPQNEKEFIDEFITYLDNIHRDDIDRFEFHGDNDYFGKQVVIFENDPYWMSKDRPRSDMLSFEIAYQSNYAISIYSANHDGFWVPEFAMVTQDHPDFSSLYKALSSAIKKVLDIT